VDVVFPSMCHVPMITNIFHLVIIAVSIAILKYWARSYRFLHRKSFVVIRHHRFEEFGMEDGVYLVYHG